MANEAAEQRQRQAERIGETHKRLNKEGEKPRNPAFPEKGQRDERLGND